MCNLSSCIYNNHIFITSSITCHNSLQVESKSCKKPKIFYNSKLTVSLNMYITIKWHARSIVHALWQHFIILHWVDHFCFGIFVFFVVVEQFIQQHMMIAALASSSLIIHNFFVCSFIKVKPFEYFFLSMKLCKYHTKIPPVIQKHNFVFID